MCPSPPIQPARVHEKFVLAKCDYFVDVQLWHRKAQLDPEQWLTNFLVHEREYAIHLLNAFLYFSTDLINEMFRAAFQSLSTQIVLHDGPFVQAQSRWQQFRNNAIITFVTGETPSETDSGYAFARKARQELKISEKRIMAPELALQTLIDEGPQPIIFVDDFVGSGDQFVTTWEREYELKDGNLISFKQFSTIRGAQFFYCPLICTEMGRRIIQTNCHGLKLCPAHVLSEKYNAYSKNSIVWPEHLRSGAFDFLEIASLRAGIPEDHIAGYKGLGLTIAFEHGVPDATLPIFYHDQNSWKPLVRRS